jgi:TetR/AcrR family acrAB operon transcriptional repressor
MVRKTKEEAEKTRQDLLDAGLAVFSQYGYEATRLSDIAEKAKVTRGAIYHHFGSKAELFLTLIEWASAAFGEIIQKAIMEGGTFEEVGTRVMVNTWVFLDENKQARQITELLYLKAGSAPELSAIADRRRAEAVQNVEWVAGIMQAAIADGELPATLDPYNGGRAFLSYQNGVAFQWLNNTDAFSLKDNAEALAKIYMRGLMGQ